MLGNQVALKVFAAIGVAATAIMLVGGALLLWSIWADARRRRKGAGTSTLKVQVSSADLAAVAADFDTVLRSEPALAALRAPTFDETYALVHAARAVAIVFRDNRGVHMQQLRVALRPESFKRIEETATARRRA